MPKVKNGRVDVLVKPLVLKYGNYEEATKALIEEFKDDLHAQEFIAFVQSQRTGEAWPSDVLLHYLAAYKAEIDYRKTIASLSPSMIKQIICAILGGEINMNLLLRRTHARSTAFLELFRRAIGKLSLKKEQRAMKGVLIQGFLELGKFPEQKQPRYRVVKAKKKKDGIKVYEIRAREEDITLVLPCDEFPAGIGAEVKGSTSTNTSIPLESHNSVILQFQEPDKASFEVAIFITRPESLNPSSGQDKKKGAKKSVYESEKLVLIRDRSITPEEAKLLYTESPNSVLDDILAKPQPPIKKTLDIWGDWELFSRIDGSCEPRPEAPPAQ